MLSLIFITMNTFDIRKPLSGQKKLYICGHRGDRTGRDENTMAAFRRAVKAGADLLETDVHMTKDGEIVLCHNGDIPGAGEIKDCTCEELINAKPDLPKLSELITFAKEHGQLGLIVELKDYPSDIRIITDPAIDPGLSPAEEAFAYGCADKACDMLLDAGLGDRVWICSFSGALMDHVYEKYGKAFRYHVFYPFFIQGKMRNDPAAYCELCCMQHRFLDEAGRVIKYEDPLCPADWWQKVRAMGMVPIAAPSLMTPENFAEAVNRGAGMINSDDPEKHIRQFGL